MVKDERRTFDTDIKGIAAISAKLTALGINIIAFIRDIVEKLANPVAGIMLYDIYLAFDKSGKKVPKPDQLKVFTYFINSSSKYLTLVLMVP